MVTSHALVWARLEASHSVSGLIVRSGLVSLVGFPTVLGVPRVVLV